MKIIKPIVDASKKVIAASLNFFYGTKCSACGARGQLVYGHYARAYNEWCSQAEGEGGHYCMNCQTIHFKTPDFNEWLKRQPKWIVPYSSLKKD